jgi:hypothetical protein
MLPHQSCKPAQLPLQALLLPFTALAQGSQLLRHRALQSIEASSV